MATFPNTLSRSPGCKGFSVVLSNEAVKIASKASGLPVLNKLFTFDPATFKFTLFLVSQADYTTIMAFYNANKDVPFDWENTQDSNTYEVIFAGPPNCTLDKLKNRWKMQFTFMQYSPL